MHYIHSGHAMQYLTNCIPEHFCIQEQVQAEVVIPLLVLLNTDLRPICLRQPTSPGTVQHYHNASNLHATRAL